LLDRDVAVCADSNAQSPGCQRFPEEMSFDPSIFASLAFLFGIAAQFRAAEGHEFLRGVIGVLEGRLGVMYAVVVVTSLISPFVLNDVLVLVLTPVLIAYSKESGADIAPLVIAEITFTNISSSLTPIGNPQNILLWQASGISAVAFVEGTWVPLLASGMIATVVLFGFKRPKWEGRTRVDTWLPAGYLAASTGLIFVLNVAGVSSLISLGLAFLVGFAFTFRVPRRVAREFDAKSLLTLYALIAAIAVLAYFIRPGLVPSLAPVALGSQPYAAGYFALLSTVISNVPATQLLVSTAAITKHAAPILAVDAGLAGNIGPVSSFANLLALLMIRRGGLSIRRAIVLQLAIGLVAFVPAFL
jgi:Na+/H+ antiporter NhaD/arsenite permease-like protein